MKDVVNDVFWEGETFEGTPLTEQQMDPDDIMELTHEVEQSVGHRVTVVMDKEEEVTKGGIKIPNAARRLSMFGTVESIGELVPPHVRVGSRVKIAYALPRVEKCVDGRVRAHVKYPEEVLSIVVRHYRRTHRGQDIRDSNSRRDEERNRSKMGDA